ncbi:MAG: diguanylate cyclase [Desulfobacula sp.]|jgi:GGDEF domain-containing protein|nr:diguanylate cyclase [Desulfobacula sp.]
MIYEGDLYASLLMVMCTVGLCSGEVVAFTPYFRLAIAYNFLALVPAMVVMLAEKVRLKSETLHLEYEGQILQASVSAGIATCVPDQKDKPQSLILKADKALYQSKANGRNQVIENC